MSHNNIQGMEKKLRQIDPNLNLSESDWELRKFAEDKTFIRVPHSAMRKLVSSTAISRISK